MSCIYTRNENYVQRKVAGEFLLMPIRPRLDDVGSLYVLNEVAGRFWSLIDGHRSLPQIKETLLSEYEVSDEQLQNDLTSLIADLRAIEALSSPLNDSKNKIQS